MKKSLLLWIFVLVALAVSAQDQLPKNARDGSDVTGHPTINTRLTAVDFNVTFTDGTPANLFTTLNAGNTVFLDQFYTT
jgi:hypothetical protein